MPQCGAAGQRHNRPAKSSTRSLGMDGFFPFTQTSIFSTSDQISDCFFDACIFGSSEWYFNEDSASEYSKYYLFFFLHIVFLAQWKHCHPAKHSKRCPPMVSKTNPIIQAPQATNLQTTRTSPPIPSLPPFSWAILPIPTCRDGSSTQLEQPGSGSSVLSR